LKIFGFNIKRNKYPSADSVVKKISVQAESWIPEGAYDPASMIIYDYLTGNGSKEPMSYQSIVLNLLRKYNGLTYLGRELTKSCIDTRVTWIAGNGVNISAKGSKEKKFLQSFIKENKLDGITFRDKVTDSELEGKVLAIPYWDSKTQMVKVKYLSWTDTNYTVICDEDDYQVITGLKYGKLGDRVLSPDEFVYKSFTGSRRFINNSPPRTGLVLFSIDAVSSALRDFREINHKFGAAFPVFEMSTSQDAKDLMNVIDKTKWRIGDTLAFVGKGHFMEPDGNGIESIVKEILMHFRIISQATGIPVYFLAPDLMSNRATAQELLEMVNAATMSERENWKDFIIELCGIAMKMYSKRTGVILDYEDVDVSIPSVTLNQVQQLVDVYLPLQEAGIISKQFVREKVPDIDPKLETERLEQEREEDYEYQKTLEVDPLDQLTGALNESVNPKKVKEENSNNAV